MANSIFESIVGMITPETRLSIATRLGEPPQAVQHGLDAATAATLNGMANRAGDPNFSDQAMQMVSHAASQNMLGRLGSVASGAPTGAADDLSSRFQSLVFGKHQSQIAGLVSQHAGLSAASGAGILRLVAPFVLGYLAKVHGSGSLSAGTLGSTLKGEASNLGGYVPAAFLRSATGAMSDTAGGVADVADATEPVAGVADTSSRTLGAVGTRASPISRSRWAVPAAVVGIVLLGWLLLRSMHVGRQANVSASTAVNTGGGTAHAAWGSLGSPINVKLPDGTALSVPSHGVETKLINYLNKASAPADEITWLDFDRLRFDSGQATLQPASNEQLNNVAAILKAYPTARISLGGFTDNTGDAAANQTLSTERADNVMAELTKRGIDPSRLSAQGYGEENPVADNSTEAGRQANRRISIRVAEK